MNDEIVLKVSKPKRDNTIYVRATQELYNKVYKGSMETGFSMSEIVRLCVENSLPFVLKSLAAVKKV